MNRLGLALLPALLLLDLAGNAVAAERDAAPATQPITLAQTTAPARAASTTVPVKRLSLAAAASEPGTDSGGICAVECKTGVQTISVSDARQQCQPAFRVPCYPFGCEPGATLCRSTCQLTAECAAGAVCDQKSHQCVVATYHCADAFTVESADGQQASCSPYRCAMGSCRETCNGPTGCADGHSCVDGRCRKP